MNQPSLTDVQCFWERASCGEDLYLDGREREHYQQQARRRYDLEPEILSFAGFEAASTLGEETENPHRDIPRAILGTAIFGGVYFVVVPAIEMMGFGTDAKGVEAFASSSSLVGDLGRSFIGPWVGNLVSLGAAIIVLAVAYFAFFSV